MAKPLRLTDPLVGRVPTETKMQAIETAGGVVEACIPVSSIRPITAPGGESTYQWWVVMYRHDAPI